MLKSVIAILERKDIAYFKFILEGYDGLCTMSTIDPHKASVCIKFPVMQQDTLMSLLGALRDQKVIKEVI